MHYKTIRFSTTCVAAGAAELVSSPESGGHVDELGISDGGASGRATRFGRDGDRDLLALDLLLLLLLLEEDLLLLASSIEG